MKKLKVLLISMALAAMLLGCSADSIMNTGKSLQNLQGINAGYAAGPKLEEAKTAVSKAVDAMIGEGKINLPDVPTDGSKLADNEEIIKLRSSLSSLADTVLAAEESGVKREKLRALFDEKVMDNENAWDEYGSYDYSNGKFCVMPKYLVGSILTVNFDVVFARDFDYVTSVFNYCSEIYEADSIQELVHGDGSGEIPDSIKELQNIVVDKVFGAESEHLKAGYLTYGDIVFTAVVSDIFASAVDIVKANPTTIDATTLLNAPEIGNILAYFDLIEYIYDVDLNLLQRVAELF